MKRSVIWQKFYIWYCRVFWILTLIGLILAPIGGSVWDIRHEGIHTVARWLNWALAVVAVYRVNGVLWLISLIVWAFRRNSASGWRILGRGVLTGIAEAIAFLIFAAGFSGA